MIREQSLAAFSRHKDFKGRVFLADGKPVAQLHLFPNDGVAHSRARTHPRGKNFAMEGRYTVFWRIKTVAPCEGLEIAEELARVMFRRTIRDEGVCRQVIEPHAMLAEHPQEGMEKFGRRHFISHYAGEGSPDIEEWQSERMAHAVFLKSHAGLRGLSTYALGTFGDQLSRLWANGAVFQINYIPEGTMVPAHREGETEEFMTAVEPEISVLAGCCRFPEQFLAEFLSRTSSIALDAEDAKQIMSRAHNFLLRRLQKLEIIG